MQRRHRVALFAAAVVLIAAVIGLTGGSHGVAIRAAETASSAAAATGAQLAETRDHVTPAALPSVRIPSVRPVDHRFDPPHLPWLLAIGAAGAALLVASGPTGNVRPTAVRVRHRPSGRAHRGRGPPRRA